MKITLIIFVTYSASGQESQVCYNFQPIATDEKCGHAKENCAKGLVCAGPWSNTEEVKWFRRNYVDSDSTNDADEFDELEDVRLWDYNYGL